MSDHLELLKEMFPMQLMLDVDQIAACMKVSPGHINNLVSGKKFPLKLLRGFGRRTMVSIVQMAKYLDGELLPESAHVVPVPATAVPKKPGRPRGTTKVRLGVQLFQTELAMAISKAKGLEVLEQAIDFVEEIIIPAHMDELCVQEVRDLKLALEFQMKALRTRFLDVVTQLVPYQIECDTLQFEVEEKG